MVDEIEQKNKEMKEPLEKAIKERNDLRKKTAGFEKTKLSLTNAKARMKQLRTAVKNLKLKREELYEKFDKVKRQNEDM